MSSSSFCSQPKLYNLVLCIYLLGFHVFGASGAPTVATTISSVNEVDKDVQILKFDNDNIGVDGYNFFFETSDGVSRKESAKLKNIGTENEAISVQGWVTWKGPDGVQYTLNYLADENGFQPEGAHLPVAPEA